VKNRSKFYEFSATLIYNEDRSVPVVIPRCDLTMYCALSAHPSLSADLSPCTGCYKLISLTLYGGPAAAVR